MPRPDERAAFRIGRFEIIRRLATGGMAELFLARFAGPSGAPQLCAVKRILPQYAGHTQFKQMFLNEARVAALLEHPNVARTFEFGEDDQGDFFIAMELVNGPTLRELISAMSDRGVVMPTELAAHITLEILEGLAHAHDLRAPDGTPFGLVHRDVSPQNLLLSREGAVKIVDFGIAKGRSIDGMTQTGFLKGKVPYMSPEQALGDAVDRRSDLFAVGVVLFELLAQERPFQAKTDVLILKAIVEQDPIPLESIVPGVPKALLAILQRALAKKPLARYARAEEFQQDLAALLADARTPVGRRDVAAFIEGVFSHPTTPERRPEPVQPTRTPSSISIEPDLDACTVVAEDLASRPTMTAEAAVTTASAVTGGAKIPKLAFAPTLSEIAVLRRHPRSPRRAALVLASFLALSGVAAGLASQTDRAPAGTSAIVIPVRSVARPTSGEPLRARPSATPATPPPRAPTPVASAPARGRDAEDHVSTRAPASTRGERASAKRERSRALDDERRNREPAREPNGRVSLTSDPPGLTVLVRDKRVGRTPLIDASLPPGELDIRLVNGDLGIAKSIPLEVKPDASTSKHVKIGRARLTVLSRPWAKVFINGLPAGDTPLRDHQVFEGQIQIRVVSEEAGQERVETVTVEADRPIVLRYVLSKEGE